MLAWRPFANLILHHLIAWVVLGFLGTAAYAQPKISPVLECVTDNDDGTYTARFGYNNTGAEAKELPIGPVNRFNRPSHDQGQPARFDPGRHVGSFSVVFDGGNLVWTLQSNGKSRTATASDHPDQRCAPEVSGNKISPIAECVVKEPDGTFTARFGYENHYNQAVRVPQGPNNKLTPSPFDGHQPATFEMPDIYEDRPGRTPFNIGAYRVNFDPEQVGNIVWTLGARTATASAATKRCPCETSTVTEVMNRSERRIEMTIKDPNGIQNVRFRSPDGSPHLENLRVELITSSGDGSGLSRTDPKSDIDWRAEGPTHRPTRVVMHLHQADRSEPDVAFFLKTKNECGTETVIDPDRHFANTTASELGIEGNAPNPFRQQTRIRFMLPEPSRVTVSVYDVMGRRVARLLDRPLSSGSHSVHWDGRFKTGRSASSGVYVYRITAGGRSEVGRMTLIR